MLVCLFAYLLWRVGVEAERQRKKWCERHLSIWKEKKKIQIGKEITDEVNIEEAARRLRNQNQIEVEIPPSQECLFAN